MGPSAFGPTLAPINKIRSLHRPALSGRARTLVAPVPNY